MMATQFSKRKELVNDEVSQLYLSLVEAMPGLCRMAVALYENESGVLHTFLKSPVESNLLTHYTVSLDEVPSLKLLAETGNSRVVDDIKSVGGDSFHSQEVSENGIRSSYTVPIFLGTELLGFVFFDSNEEAYFSENIVNTLAVYVKLIEALLALDILPVRALMGMISSSRRLTELKDRDTGKHIARVASYVEMIATELAMDMPILDEVIEYMWLYAPLHDLGKIGVPDDVLLKPERLDETEFNAMKKHVQLGVDIMTQILEDFKFQHLHHTDILKNMISTHHERWDGLGYPNGLSGEDIPLEGRILAVADVFDAMSSSRVYRERYSLDETFNYIESHAGRRFDPKCVAVFLAQREKVVDVYHRFQERGV